MSCCSTVAQDRKFFVSFSVSKFETDEAEELLSIDLASNLPLGPAKLHATFEGCLNDRLVGFYRSKYTQVLQLVS